MTLQIDPAAEFLLHMRTDNLFEILTAYPGDTPVARCKGCYGLFTLKERESHHRAHVRAQNRSESLRREKIKKERIKRLAQARALR